MKRTLLAGVVLAFSMSCASLGPPQFAFTRIDGAPVVLMKSCGARLGELAFAKESPEGLNLLSRGVSGNELSPLLDRDGIVVVEMATEFLPEDTSASDTAPFTFFSYSMSGSTDKSGRVRLPGGPWPAYPQALPEMSADSPGSQPVVDLLSPC